MLVCDCRQLMSALQGQCLVHWYQTGYNITVRELRALCALRHPSQQQQ